MKAIFWDNDGVLVDSEPLYFETTRDAIAELGVELTLAEFAELSLRTGASAFDVAVARGISAERIEAARLRRNERYGERLAGTELIPGVREALAALHGRVPMAVVTSSRPRPLRDPARAHRRPLLLRVRADRRGLHTLQARSAALSHGGGPARRRPRRLSGDRGQRARAPVGRGARACAARWCRARLTPGGDFSAAFRVLERRAARCRRCSRSCRARLGSSSIAGEGDRRALRRGRPRVRAPRRRFARDGDGGVLPRLRGSGRPRAHEAAGDRRGAAGRDELHRRAAREAPRSRVPRARRGGAHDPQELVGDRLVPEGRPAARARPPGLRESARLQHLREQEPGRPRARQRRRPVLRRGPRAQPRDGRLLRRGRAPARDRLRAAARLRARARRGRGGARGSAARRC